MTNAPLEQLSTRLLAQSAYEALRRMIITGQLAPGTRIRVDDLASRWHVSRTPVREAVSRLVLVDLVTVARNSRTAVAHWTPGDMLERAEMIGTLAEAAGERAMAMVPSAHDGSGEFDDAEADLLTARATASDVRAFVTLCCAMLGRSGNRVALSTVSVHLAPLVGDFYVPAIAGRFGVRLDVAADERRTLVADLRQAIDAGDAPCVRSTIAAYVAALRRSHEGVGSIN